METERLLLLGNLAFMNRPDQNCQSTLALSGKGQSCAALHKNNRVCLSAAQASGEWCDPAKPRQSWVVDRGYRLAPAGKRKRRPKPMLNSHLFKRIKQLTDQASTVESLKNKRVVNQVKTWLPKKVI